MKDQVDSITMTKAAFDKAMKSAFNAGENAAKLDIHAEVRKAVLGELKHLAQVWEGTSVAKIIEEEIKRLKQQGGSNKHQT